MSIGVWNPGAALPIDRTQLQTLVDGLPIEALENLNGLKPDDFQRFRAWMKLEAQLWKVAEAFDVATRQQLIRFFTLSERDWAGWEAGKTSPVIPLVAGLKQVDGFDPEFRRWIKSNTDNRYLPNGAVL